MKKDNKIKKWSFDIDRGGTFTDIVAHSPAGKSQVYKFLSNNPDSYVDAPLFGIKSILGLKDHESVPPGAISEVRMGTTVATNALLERKGAPTALICNKGFKDILKIGYQQRPDLFAQPILKPETLYQEAFEIGGRLDAKGNMIEEVDRTEIEALLRQAQKKGLNSIAVCLMHAYLNPVHEQEVGKIAREIGFDHIALSHEIMPLVKIVNRGDTTIVDAYLSPILKAYTDRLSEQLSGTRILFMQSHGGLSKPSHFRGYNAILSGPAGGVIATVATSQKAGFEKIIGFDMGGTSTDVCHYAGEWERSNEHQVAGVRLQTPMLDIHTIAAGGGSKIDFDGFRLQVGPESAGSYPGPSSYRQGGPLTVTDCNVLLGKINPRFFPAVFGRNQNQPLDGHAVEVAFEELAKSVSSQSGKDSSALQLAEGCLKIACQQMAAAIKKISIERGHNLEEYVLTCFGSAAGQHACLVADELDMKRILIHPFGGVLSAYGMGLAEINVLKESSCSLTLDDEGLSHADEKLKALEKQCQKELKEQGVALQSCRSSYGAFLSYKGSDQSLKVSFSSLGKMRHEFEKKHRGMYGFTLDDTDIVFSALAVEMNEERKTDDKQTFEILPSQLKKEDKQARFFSGGRWHQAKLYDWSLLYAGQTITGPAMILSRTQTIIVEPSWQACVKSEGSLVLEKMTQQHHHKSEKLERDPITLEIFNHRFRAIAEQMGVRLAQTAHSVNIKERLDFSCALFDSEGNLIANAPHVPVHLGSMAEAIKGFASRQKDQMRPGDHYAHNDPNSGGTHLPDVTVITPVYLPNAQSPDFFVASRGHHADIGGMTPGSMPAHSTSIEQEGIVIKDLLLARQGKLHRQEIISCLAQKPYPARNIEQNLADLSAQIAANEKGLSELIDLCQKEGTANVKAYMGYLKDYADLCVKNVIKNFSNHRYHLPLDAGRFIEVNITYDQQDGRCTIDFSGTSAVDAGNFNAPQAVTKAAVLFVLRSLIKQDIPLNQGCLRHIDIKIPEKSLLNPGPSDAVVSGNVETSQAIANALFAALGKLAPSPSTMNNFSFGNEEYQYYETICNGSGAGEGFDGCDAVQVHMTNSRLTDPEIFELRFPVRLHRFEIAKNSGGKGRHNGGNGVVREIEFLFACKASLVTGNREVSVAGLQGGEPGKAGKNLLHKRDADKKLPACTSFEVKPGERIIIQTPGGGGFGKSL